MCFILDVSTPPLLANLSRGDGRKKAGAGSGRKGGSDEVLQEGVEAVKKMKVKSLVEGNNGEEESRQIDG